MRGARSEDSVWSKGPSQRLHVTKSVAQRQDQTARLQEGRRRLCQFGEGVRFAGEDHDVRATDETLIHGKFLAGEHETLRTKIQGGVPGNLEALNHLNRSALSTHVKVEFSAGGR